MSDLTVLFQNCVHIYEQTGDIRTKSARKTANDENKPQDTLLKEALEVSKFLSHILKFIKSVRKPYLLSSTVSRQNQKEDESLTEDQKDKIDEEINLQLHKISQKIKFLETYEDKHYQNMIQNRTLPSYLGKKMMHSHRVEEQELYEDTMRRFKKQVLTYLTMSLKETSTSFMEMKQQRLSKKREIQKSNFFADSLLEENEIEDDHVSEDEQAEEPNESFPPASSQQLQILEQENTELLLANKNKELAKAKSLENSIMDITGLINEISLQLSDQSSAISQMMDNHEDVLQDVKLGNLELLKTRDRNSKSTKSIVTIIMALSIFLLVVDFLF